jgi:uncharacterized metal-binding protein YceD (DUF177 family)
MTPGAPPLSRIVKRDEVPDTGLIVALKATPQERDALAAFLGIPAVETATGEFVVSRWRGRGLAVTGTVSADVLQTCVVTLDPVATRIEEPVESYFAPAPSAHRAAARQDDSEITSLDVDELIDDRIDVGVLMAEHLALGLPAYPRKPGVVFQPETDENGGEPDRSAFAALSKLRNRREDGE